MLHHFLRAFLVLAILAVGMSYVESGTLLPAYRMVLLIGALILALITITIEIALPRKSLQALGGVFFGLTAGLLIAYALTLVLNLVASGVLPNRLAKVPAFQEVETLVQDANGNPIPGEHGFRTQKTKIQVGEKDHPAMALTKVLLGIVCCYFCVSFVMQTKDDIRFVIPYVEFAKQIKGEHPLILDTSVIIDGRIADICDTGVIDQRVIVPRFILRELQAIADSNDKLKRARGRRGLDILHRLQTTESVDIQVMEARLSKAEDDESVDLKLLALAQQLNGSVATNDYNLNKVAKLRKVRIININDLANALKPVVLPGESMTTKIIKAGEEAGQGIGYLDDGTMVVVEHGRSRIGDTVDVSVTSVLQTSAGRMIFGRLSDDAPPRRRPSPHRRA